MSESDTGDVTPTEDSAPAPASTPKRKRRVSITAIVLLLLGAIIAVTGVLVALNMRDASLATGALLQDEVNESGTLSYLEIYRIQYFAIGFALASAIAGALLFLGAFIRLLIRR
jgi:hypothetical protein